MSDPVMKSPILDINNLVVSIGKKPKGANIIDGISIQVHAGETLCLVGESGSGKSVTSLTTMGLLPKGTLVPSSGSVKLVGEEILTATDRRLRQLRATQMAMIFQEPMTIRWCRSAARSTKCCAPIPVSTRGLAGSASSR
jgi:peptide/nickel transport system ATP-binding protein